METTEKLYKEISPEEYSRIPHVIYLDDFNTNYPASNRVERIAREIDEYIKWKQKHIEMKG
jgi:hypothetical protein